MDCVFDFFAKASEALLAGGILEIDVQYDQLVDDTIIRTHLAKATDGKHPYLIKIIEINAGVKIEITDVIDDYGIGAVDDRPSMSKSDSVIYPSRSL